MSAQNKKRKSYWINEINYLNINIFYFFRYTVPVKVQTQQPYQLRTYAWCWSIPPKCSRYKIQMKTVFKTEVEFWLFLILIKKKLGWANSFSCRSLNWQFTNYIFSIYFRWSPKSELWVNVAEDSLEVQMDPLVFLSVGNFLKKIIFKLMG